MTSVAEDLLGFHRFLTARVESGAPDLSPEAILDQWRRLHPDSADLYAEEIDEALDSVDAGRKGMTLEEYDRDFRRRHNIPDDA